MAAPWILCASTCKPMKMAKYILCAAGFLATCLLSSAQAQFNIEWYTLIGGYQISGGGNYSIASSAVESTGGTVTGGVYVLQGGDGLQGYTITSGNPKLVAFCTGNSCVVSWPATAEGFTLQQASDLTAPSWQNVPEAAAEVGSQYVVTIPVTNGCAFFRL